jgi:hypothetical protein
MPLIASTERSISSIPFGSRIAVTEIELCQITVQVLLAAMLIDTAHTALEYREEALKIVGHAGLAIFDYDIN